MKKIISFLLAVMMFITLVEPVSAINDPRNYPNNRFGVHILSTGDLDDAAKLINSSGGDWGYVTLVIREDERESKFWQEVFKKMSEAHVIPIVRIATTTEKIGWVKPDFNEIEKWRVFLQSLPWPVENRYVIVGNEVNSAKEWGGKLEPDEYAKYLKEFSTNLKQYSDDYFILPAGLDASAPNDRNHMSEDLYLRKMVEAEPEIFNFIDGWNSHSYPNPDFSGNPVENGRGTVRTFIWEKEYLKSLGVEKDLPVFITETGWAHDMNGRVPYLIDTALVGDHFKSAFANAWNDSNVVAVTPFVLSHSNAPFDIFSWKDKNGQFYKFYDDLKTVTKIKGEPKLAEPKKILGINDEIVETECKISTETPLVKMQKSQFFGKIWEMLR